jgi:hypothetical protein
MNQYLDQKDGKWHLTISVDVPRLLIKNKLNFRIYNVAMKSGEVIRDPSFNLSSYIFSVAPSFMGKKVFFSSYFEPKEIEDVVQFKFGFCDERVRWHENTIISIKNEMPVLTSGPEIHQVENLSVKQELVAAKDMDFVKEIPSEIHIDTVNCTDFENIIEVSSKVEIMAEEPLSAFRTGAPKKAASKKVGRKKK